MYLFQRGVTLRGGVRQPLGWAIEMTQFVNARGGVEVSLWSSLFGTPLGTVVWSARVASHAELAQVTDRLMADPDYHALIEKGQPFIEAPGQDALRQLVHAAKPSAETPPVGSVAGVVTAIPAAGHIREALAWGAEIATMYADITGASTLFLADAYGPFGQLTWFTNHADMAAVDAANGALQANPAYLASIDGAGALFVPGSGMQGLAVRVA